MTAEVKKILLIGFGNPARADDGLGPAVAENIGMKNLPGVTVDADYQLTIEDSAAVAENDAVIFADASVNCAEPFVFEPIEGAKTGGSFSSHSVEPAEVMGLAENLFKSKAKGYMLAVRGYKFDDFDAPMTKKAEENLGKAIIFLEDLLKTKNFKQVSFKGDYKMQDGKYVILAIDDDPDFLQALRLLLEANGYIMVQANSAEAGLKVYKEKNPDLVLVDLMMESIDAGADFVKELRLLGNTAPVFLLSGAGDGMTTNVDYSQYGFSGVFQKPVKNERLISVIKAKLK